MTFFSTPEKLEIGDVPFIVASDKPTRSDALHYYRRVVRHFDLRVCQYEEVTGICEREGRFVASVRRMTGERSEWSAPAVVLATGNFDTPNPLGVPGENLAKVTHYFREPHGYFQQDVLVVGGGNSAVEAALSVWRAGGRATLCHQFAAFDRGVKPWVLPDIENRIREGSIPVHWRHKVARIEARTVRLSSLDGGGEFELANDWVLAMTGYRPDHRLLNLLGVPVDPNTHVPQYEGSTLQTPVPGVYVAGVVVAGGDAGRVFIENGRKHGEQIVRHLLKSGRIGVSRGEFR